MTADQLLIPPDITAYYYQPRYRVAWEEDRLRLLPSDPWKTYYTFFFWERA